ncbi:hypothetical protein RND81_11G076800 [Saponaria officinalis]|uniref:Synergin gamma C-terminal domain-containing protein n=1 Tax=Saponaria officinalis TaxID=3572 RepID=A0AAW1HK57_SAPOF
MISGFVQNGNSQKALNFFRNMEFSGIDPNKATMLALLPACSDLAVLKFRACAHGFCVTKRFLADTLICSALIDMYAKCGRVKMYREVFRNSIIVVYGIYGHGSEALLLFNELRTVGLKPVAITFIGLLIACSHSGLVAEAKHWFDAMAREFQIVPRTDHYICMVDLLGQPKSVCRLSLLPQEMLPGLKTVLGNGQPYFTSLTNLWANLINPEPPQ